MSDTVIGIYTIGQTPRPDLTEQLAGYLGAAHGEIRGALDELDANRIPACPPDGYPLETRLRDGTRVVVDAEFVEPLLQQAIDECDDRVAAHLVLCAGRFPNLTAHHPLIRPFDVAAAELTQYDLRSLEVVVPFAAQAGAAAGKWVAAGFSCRPHPLDKIPQGEAVAQWLIDRLASTRADALVLDYVGPRPAYLEAVGARIGLPVLDLGQSSLDALAKLAADAQPASS